MDTYELENLVRFLVDHNGNWQIWALQLFETHKLFGFCPEYIVTSLWVWIPKVDVTIYNGTASEFCRTKPVPTLYRFEISSNYDSVCVLSKK